MAIAGAEPGAEAAEGADRVERSSDGPAASFLDALRRRDFGALASVLAPDARFRALVPPGPVERTGRGEVVEQLARWFGAADDFEVQDVRLEQVADRVRISYRFRLRPHPFTPGSGWHVIEQQGYCRAGDGGLEALDVVCTGFRPEPVEGPGFRHALGGPTR